MTVRSLAICWVGVRDTEEVLYLGKSSASRLQDGIAGPEGMEGTLRAA